MDTLRGSTEPVAPVQMVASPLLELREIAHNFSGLKVLECVNLSVVRGAITGLIGPNGSGKTTCFNIASGFLFPAGGRVFLDNQNVTGKPVTELSRSGLIRTFQTPQVFEHMTVLENVMVGFHSATNGGWLSAMFRAPAARKELAATRDKAVRICEQFELNKVMDVRAGTLPAGRKRIVELARSFAAKPRLLMLDEPSSGLNTEEIVVLKSWIEWLHQQGTTIVLVSHDMALMTVAHWVHALYFGKIIASGSFSQIQADERVREAYLGV